MGSVCWNLSIAGLPIRMELERPVPMTDAFRPFLTALPPRYTGRFRQVETLPPFDDRILYTGNCYRTHPDGTRSFFDAPRDMTPYALTRTDHEAGTVDVDYLEKGTHCVSQMDNSFFHLGFEGLLIRHDRICFHAACVRTDRGRHGGGTQINGDRPVLGKNGDEWRAWGSPYAGSSNCFVNESVPVTALVFLAQEPVNRIRRLKPGEAFRRIYAQLTMYSWDQAFVDRACDLAIALAGGVPSYEFGCVPDETAVAFLEHRLKEDIP